MPIDREQFDRVMFEGGSAASDPAPGAGYDRSEFDRVMFGGGAGELDERAAREPARTHRVRGADGRAVEVELTPERVAAIEAGELALDPGARVWVESGGERFRLAGDDATAAIAEGAKLLPSRDERAIEHEATLEEAYGDRPGSALLQGFASGATLGLYDLGARALGQGEQLREVTAREPAFAFAGEALGMVTGAALSGGASLAGRAAAATPAALAARAGAGVTRRLGGGFAARTAGLAVEGGIFGAGAGAAQLGRSEDPLTIERALSTVGTNALLGVAAGAGTSVLGKALSKGLGRAKTLADDVARGADEAAPIVGEVAAYTEARRGAFLVAGKNKAPLGKASTRIRDALNTPREVGKRPGRLLAPLEQEEVVLRELIDEGDDAILKRLAGGDRKLAAEVAEQIGKTERKAEATLARLERKTERLAKAETRAAEQLAKARAKGQPADVLDAIKRRQADAAQAMTGHRTAIEAAQAEVGAARVKLTGGAATIYRDVRGISGSDDLAVGLTDAQALVGELRSGALNARRAEAVTQLPDMLAQNRALSTEINRLVDAGRGRGLGGAMTDRGIGAMTGAVLGGPAGAALGMFAPTVLGKVNELVSKRLTKAATEAAARTSSVIDAIMSKGATSTRVAVPVASKILGRMSYAPPRRVIEAEGAAATGLVADFKSRERELRDLTEPTPDGRMRMRRARREELAARLDGARMVSPVLADKIEALAARRVEFLAAKLPKRPDSAAIPIGPDVWRPSDYQIRAFARFAAAVEDPGAVEERIADGSVTPEDAEAYRDVYPERFAALQQAVIERLPELRHRLEYAKRLGLSIMFGVAVDPAMDPRVLAVLQSTYAAEDGTDGGAQAPPVKPHFGALGSLPGDKPTKAQERAG